MKDKPKKRERWTEEDLKWLKSNMGRFTYKEIAEKLGRTELAIKGITIVKGWARPKSKWTVNQIKLLEEMWGKVPIEELKKKIGKTEDAIACKAHRLKITNS